MTRSWLNPKQSDYKGQSGCGVIAVLIGFLFSIIGMAVVSEWGQTILVSLGIALIVGGIAIIYTAAKSRSRAKMMKEE